MRCRVKVRSIDGSVEVSLGAPCAGFAVNQATAQEPPRSQVEELLARIADTFQKCARECEALQQFLAEQAVALSGNDVVRP